MSNPNLLTNRYRIIQHLGSGGFGDTFLAEDTHLPSGRTCVIKKLRPMNNNLQVYQLVKERFQREAAILEDLGNGHGQIPTLFAYFEEQEQFYLVQEYIQGDTLSNLLKKQGKLTEDFIKIILLKLLEVLEYLQSKRIIHRDIKPDNIIVRQSDQLPILIDFGAVREAMGTVTSSGGSLTSSIVIGTPGFMPPEQSIGRPVFSSDLYALGLTAICLLTGRSPRELEKNPLDGEILWRKYALHVSPTLSNVIDQSIKAQTNQRFATAQLMRQALQEQSMMASTEPYFPPPQNQKNAVTQPIASPQPDNQVFDLFKITFFAVIIGITSLVGWAFFFRDNAVKTSNNLQTSSPQNLVWRSESNLTRIANLNQICFGTSTIGSVQTVFGYDKLTFSGAITIPSTKTGGCTTGDTLQGIFEMSGNSGNCVGTIKITWQDNDNAYVQWNINNLGSACPVSTRDWSTNTYPVEF